MKKIMELIKKDIILAVLFFIAFSSVSFTTAYCRHIVSEGNKVGFVLSGQGYTFKDFLKTQSAR